MECLYCHKRLGFFASKKRPFCSELHEVAYQDEQKGLALRRVMDPLFTEPVRKPPLQPSGPPAGSLVPNAPPPSLSKVSFAPAETVGPTATPPPTTASLEADAPSIPPAATSLAPAAAPPTPTAAPPRDIGAQEPLPPIELAAHSPALLERRQNGEAHSPRVPPPFESFLQQATLQPVPIEQAVPLATLTFEWHSAGLEFPRNGTLATNPNGAVEDDSHSGAPESAGAQGIFDHLHGLLPQAPDPHLNVEDPGRAVAGPVEFKAQISLVFPAWESRSGTSLLREPALLAARLLPIELAQFTVAKPAVPEVQSSDLEPQPARPVVKNLWRAEIPEPLEAGAVEFPAGALASQIHDPRGIPEPVDFEAAAPRRAWLHDAVRLGEPELADAPPVLGPPVSLATHHLPVFEVSAEELHFVSELALPRSFADWEMRGLPEAPTVAFPLRAVLPRIQAPRVGGETLRFNTPICLTWPSQESAPVEPLPEPDLSTELAPLLAAGQAPAAAAPDSITLSAFRVPDAEVEFPRRHALMEHAPEPPEESLLEAAAVACRVSLVLPQDIGENIAPELSDPLEVKIPISLNRPLWPAERIPAVRSLPDGEGLPFGELMPAASLLPVSRVLSADYERGLVESSVETSPHPRIPAVPSAEIPIIGVKLRKQIETAWSDWSAIAPAEFPHQDQPSPVEIVLTPAAPEPVPDALAGWTGPAPSMILLPPLKPVAGWNECRLSFPARLVGPAGASALFPELFFPKRASTVTIHPSGSLTWTVNSRAAHVPLIPAGVQAIVIEPRLPLWRETVPVMALNTFGWTAAGWGATGLPSCEPVIEGPCASSYLELFPVPPSDSRALAPRKILSKPSLNFQIRRANACDQFDSSGLANSSRPLQPFRPAARIQIRQPEPRKPRPYKNLAVSFCGLNWRSLPMSPGAHQHGSPLPFRRPAQTPPVR